jgi:hypothetical protein
MKPKVIIDKTLPESSILTKAQFSESLNNLFKEVCEEVGCDYDAALADIAKAAGFVIKKSS